MPTTLDVISESKIAFGTSGARGLVEQFSDDTCAALTLAFLTEMKKSFAFKSVAIAMDRRPSSPQMASACAGLVHSLGLKVDFYGILPTPALALQAMRDNVPSIMITGSHIPFDRNGIKFYRPDGEISKSDEAAILSADEELPGFHSFLPEESDRARVNYIRRYTDLYPSDALHGLRVGLYEHSAAGREISKEILERLGAEVVSLGRTETFVPIDTEAVSDEDRARGRQWAEEHDLDAIFSTDGDGDRPLLADEDGDWLRGDILGLLCAKILGVEALAVPVSCNTAIELTGAFEAIARTRIGSPYVIEGMEKLATRHAKVAGFEANGGFLLQTDLSAGSARINKLPTRDALLPAVVVLTSAISTNKTTSQLVAELPPRFTASDRIQNIPTDRSKDLIANLKQTPEKLKTDLKLSQQVVGIDKTDGFRATLANGQIVHLRPSGNAPELRCYCEAESMSAAQNLLEHSLDYIRSALAGGE